MFNKFLIFLIALQNFQYQYYASGLLSNFDKFPEQQRRIIGSKKKKKEKRMDKSGKKLKKGLKGKRQNGDSQVKNE